MALELTDANFDEKVIKADKPVIVDFWAEWCGPCRIISPIINEIAEEYKDRAIVGKVDVDNNPNTAERFGIRNIPTVLYFKNGVVVDKVVGASAKANFVNRLEKLF